MATASGRSPGASNVSRAPAPFSSSARLRTRARQASILASSSPEIRYAGLRPATILSLGRGSAGASPRPLDLEVALQSLVPRAQRPDLLRLALEPVEELVGRELAVVAHVLATLQQP